MVLHAESCNNTWNNSNGKTQIHDQYWTISGVSADSTRVELAFSMAYARNFSTIADDIENIFKRYEYINIKLDKTGGLTEGLKIAKRAKELEKGIMIGCMVGSSLSMLPALMLYE